MCNRLFLFIAAAILILAASCGFDGSYSVLISENGANSTIRSTRFNDAGQRDPALSGTVEFSSYTQGAVTTVEIAVVDSEPMYGAVLELLYDEKSLTPINTEFLGLVDTPIEMALTNRPGVVSLGQADPEGKAIRQGRFARVEFRHRPFSAPRAVSATYSDPVNFAYAPPQLSEGRSGFELVKATAEDEDPAAFRIYSTFAAADGDDNSETNIADITPLVAQGNFNTAVSDSNFGPAATDYDRNGEVNIADLVPIAINNGRVNSGIEVRLGDSDDLTAADTFTELAFADGAPAARSGNPFTSTDWTTVWRTWDGEISLADMEAADTDEDGTVFVSARLMDAGSPGELFTGLPLTYDTGPGEITAISLDFEGSDTWPTDGDGNFIVLLSELAVDDIDGNAEDFATELLNLRATVDTTKDSGVDGTDMVLWALTEGGGLAAVSNGAEKGMLTFSDRGKITVEAHKPGDFSLNDSLSFVLLSIEELALELEGGGTGPASVAAGAVVQFEVTGTFDWDGTPNGNEVDVDLTTFCNWAQIAAPGNTGTFTLFTDLGALGTSGASSGDSTQVSCEYPRTDNVTLYDNMKRVSNLVQIDVL